MDAMETQMKIMKEIENKHKEQIRKKDEMIINLQQEINKLKDELKNQKPSGEMMDCMDESVQPMIRDRRNSVGRPTKEAQAAKGNKAKTGNK